MAPGSSSFGPRFRLKSIDGLMTCNIPVDRVVFPGSTFFFRRFRVLSSLYIPRSQSPSICLQRSPPPSLPCWRPTYQTRIDISLLGSDPINKKTTPPLPSHTPILVYNSNFSPPFIHRPRNLSARRVCRVVACLFCFPLSLVFAAPPKGRALQRSARGAKDDV